MIGTFVARFLKIVILEFRVIFARLIRIALLEASLLWIRRNYVGDVLGFIVRIEGLFRRIEIKLLREVFCGFIWIKLLKDASLGLIEIRSRDILFGFIGIKLLGGVLFGFIGIKLLGGVFFGLIGLLKVASCGLVRIA